MRERPLYGQCVGLTGIIYGTIVVAWAAYLVPLALRRHDQAARSRSVDRFAATMRVLSRHGATTSGRVVVTPPRPVDRVLSPGLVRTGSTAVGVPSRRPSRAALAAAARRRRRVLVGLLIGTAVVAVAAALGFLPLWSLSVPIAMVAGFLVIARRQVRRMSDSYWVESRTAVPGPSNVIRYGSTRVEATHGATTHGARTHGVAMNPDDEPTVPLDADHLKIAVAALDQERSVAVPLPTADGGSLWDPLPIMLPTYVDKPVAQRTIRTVELGGPATVPSGRAAEPTEPAAPANAALHTPEAVEESEPVGAEPARAVNG